MGFVTVAMLAMGLQIALVGAVVIGPGASMPAPDPGCGIGRAPANVQRLEVKAGDRLASLLRDAGARRAEIGALRRAFGRKPNLHALSIGDRIDVATTREGQVAWFRYRKELMRAACAERTLRGSFVVHHAELEARTDMARIEVAVERDLRDAMRAAGESAALAAMVEELFVDRDLTPAADAPPPRVTVVVERRTVEGALLDYGRIFAAELAQGEQVERAFHFVARDGGRGYYTADGAPRLGTRLRSPVPGATLTSGYGWRYHPIKRRRRMHQGIDFGAAHGTPVLAAADGVVTLRRWKGPLGRTVILRHPDGLVTRYAHLSSFSLRLRRGQKVRQGQTIGYVGSTGLSSGAHLHFETLVGGRHRNPARLLRAPAPAIPEAELEAFEAHVAELLTLLHPDGSAPTDA